MILKELLNNNFQQIRTKELCQLRQIELISRHRHPVFRCAFIHLKKERKDDSILWRQPHVIIRRRHNGKQILYLKYERMECLF